MPLDARFGALLDSEYCALYTKVASELAEPYLELRGRLAEAMGSDVDWLVSSPAIRDNFSSPLFHFCVIVKLLAEHYAMQQSLPEVVVDSREFGSVLEELYENLSCTARIELRPEFSGSILKKLRRKIAPANVMVRRLLVWWRVKRHAGRCRLPRASSGEFVRLVDTFLVSTDTTKDRYYDGLFESLNSMQSRETYIVPTFHNLSASEITQVVKEAKRESKQFLFKEGCLKLSDIFWASGHFLRLRRLRIPQLNWCGVDISPIFRRELKAGRHLEGAFIGLVNFRFFRALKAANLEVSETIDWFENQSVDVGWNFGAHTFFPGAKTLGYQGFFQANDGASPASYEYHLGVVPRKLCVMGPGLREQRARWCPEIKIEIAPAFRFRWLWQINGQGSPEQTYEAKDPPILLTVLPADTLTANFLLALIGKICERYRGWRFWVKFHPSLPPLHLDNWTTVSTKVETVSGSLQKLFAARPLVLSGGMTTAGLEALAFGIPAIFCCPPGREHQLPVPDALRTMSLLTCKSAEELMLAIEETERILKVDQRHFLKRSLGIRKELFAPVTPQGLTALGFVN